MTEIRRNMTLISFCGYQVKMSQRSMVLYEGRTEYVRYWVW